VKLVYVILLATIQFHHICVSRALQVEEGTNQEQAKRPHSGS